MIKIIAEAGVNHNGDEALAMKLVDIAYQAGADIVKFQTFKAKNLVTSSAEMADYQVKNTGVNESQFSMLSRLELNYDAHKRLIKHCNDLGIEFLSTAFDGESLDFLVDDLKLKTLKVSSGELTNLPFLLAHAKTGCNIIISTGMAVLSEIEIALGVLAFGLLNDPSIPSITAFNQAYCSAEGQAILKEKVTILHCTTEYPAPVMDINLNAIDTLRAAFGLNVGFSDHSAGIYIPIAAAAKKITVLEKHFTLDKNMEGPDHKASLDPNELLAMVKGIRDIELAMGDGIKRPTESELKNKIVARKSLVASKAIKTGEVFTPNNIEIKRPGTGRSPEYYWEILGRRSSKDLDIGDFI